MSYTIKIIRIKPVTQTTKEWVKIRDAKNSDDENYAYGPPIQVTKDITEQIHENPNSDADGGRMSNDYGRPEPKLDEESLDIFIGKVRDAHTPDDVLKRERQIKQLAEAIYQAQWDYRGLTTREEMVPYFEEIIRGCVDDEAKKQG